MEIHSIFLNNLHRFELFEARLLYETIVVHIAIIGEVTGISDIAHIAYFVT